MGRPHALLVPYAAQGHVIPMMELMQRLVKHGVKVTFLNTEFTHRLVTDALSEGDKTLNDLASFVSLPDGVETEEDRKDVCKVTDTIFEVMPGKLQELIERLNGNGESERVTCVVADTCMGWAFEVAERMKIKSVGFWTASASGLAVIWSIPKFVEDGIIDEKGAIMKKQMVHISPTMPAISSENFMWARIGDTKMQEAAFDLTIRINEFVKLADYVICNSSYELEATTFTSFPNILPIGPLLASNRVANQIGHFWKEDTTCLTWLDKQPLGSVIYVAFGSFTLFDCKQFQELAHGLEMTKRPFLFVVRPDMSEVIKNSEYLELEGYTGRISSRGKIVGWAPQQKVLNHPSVGCFVSHCGWNSVLEGITCGLPFLCWPYFSDQFLNQMFICGVWKTGLEFEKDKSGVVLKEEIRDKIEQILENNEFKVRAVDLKEKVADAVGKGGHSDKNFSNFIDWIQDT